MHISYKISPPHRVPTGGAPQNKRVLRDVESSVRTKAEVQEVSRSYKDAESLLERVNFWL